MALHLHQLKKVFVSPDGSAVPVIDVHAFSLGTGEQAALVGGSGTGKTTLLHLIAGILTPDRGRILFTPKSNGQGSVAGGSGSQGQNSAASAAGGGAVLAYRTARGAEPPGGNGAVDVAALSEAERDVFRGRHVGY